MTSELKDNVVGGKEDGKVSQKSMLLIGPHVNKDVVNPKEGLADHIKATIKEASDHGVNVRAIQIFIANPRTGKSTLEIGSAQCKELKTYIADHPEIFFVAHSPYVTTALWADNAYAGHIMRAEMKIADDIGLRGIVMHLDSHGIDDVVKYLPKIMPKLSNLRVLGLPKIYLESSHTKPDKAKYNNPEDIAKLFSRIRKEIDPHLNRLSFCLDTAHQYVSGVDLSSKENAAKWIEGMKLIHNVLPPENIMIHLNGSLFNCGDGRDAHAQLMVSDDKLWGAYKDKYAESGLAQFINYAKEFNIPMILERRHGYMYTSDYELLYEHVPSIRVTQDK